MADNQKRLDYTTISFIIRYEKTAEEAGRSRNWLGPIPRQKVIIVEEVIKQE